jgi:3-oxoacyl-[acyl-carrier-protein] synthase III
MGTAGRPDMSAVITGAAGAVGTPVLLTELPRRAMPADVAERLVVRGQKLCPVAADDMPLVAESAGASLAATGTSPAAVRHVLVATETLAVSGSRAAHEETRGRLHRTLAELGLGHAPVTALMFGGCSAVMTALEYAGLLVERDPDGCVLVVAVGRMRDGDSRVLAPEVSALGDGAASCLVRAGGDGWTVRPS